MGGTDGTDRFCIRYGSVPTFQEWHYITWGLGRYKFCVDIIFIYYLNPYYRMKIVGVFDRGSVVRHKYIIEVPPSMLAIFEKISTLTITNIAMGEEGMYIVEGQVQKLQELLAQWTIPYSNTTAKIQSVEVVGSIREVTCEGISKDEVQIILDDPLCVITDLDFGTDKWKFRYSGPDTLADLMNIFK